MNPKPLTRRSFLKQSITASLAIPCLVPGSVLGLGGMAPPSERVALGLIGAGGRGSASRKGHVCRKTAGNQHCSQ